MRVTILSCDWCRCIVDLTTTQEDARPGVWGGGRDLVLELDEGSLKLIEPDTGACLNSQPIHAIRVSSKQWL